MATRFTESDIYGSAWAHPEVAALFDERARLRAWLDCFAHLAEVEAEVGLIPADAAADVATTCRNLPVDDALLAEARAGFAETGHSIAGLIRAVARRCPAESGQWIWYGATVQDLTDTWFMATLERVRQIVTRDLDRLAEALARLAAAHRGTVMAGRTHGQPGLPITFGFKAAGWLAEVDRHRVRLSELADRMGVGQLAGGVGSLSAFGPQALAVQERFLARVGLRPPTISWTASRDVPAEWCTFLALLTGTLDRIAHEIYALQRPEIGELHEGFVEGTIGSITMPHKRNPERSEHIGTLARVTRYAAALMLEGLGHEHERDGRAWKAEWQALPEATLSGSAALWQACELIEGLVVDADRMRANLGAGGQAVASEAVMLALARRIGKLAAHEHVYRLAMAAAEAGRPFRDAVLDDPLTQELVGVRRLEEILDSPGTGACELMVDRTLDAHRGR
jgi:adenylosuccinate lyase